MVATIGSEYSWSLVGQKSLSWSPKLQVVHE